MDNLASSSVNVTAGRRSSQPAYAQSARIFPEHCCVSDTMILSESSRDAVDCGASALVMVNDPPKDCKDGLIRYICCQKNHAFSIRSCMCCSFF
ncbi:uncharacterized [Tachysurus ichikawai]